MKLAHFMAAYLWMSFADILPLLIEFTEIWHALFGTWFSKYASVYILISRSLYVIRYYRKRGNSAIYLQISVQSNVSIISICAFHNIMLDFCILNFMNSKAVLGRSPDITQKARYLILELHNSVNARKQCHVMTKYLQNTNKVYGHGTNIFII